MDKPKLPQGWVMAGKYPVKQVKSPMSAFHQQLVELQKQSPPPALKK